MKHALAALCGALLLSFTAAASASGGADLRLEPALVNRLDDASLQRGARTFVNYCLNCHGAKYMRYNRLTDLGVDLEMVQDNLVFTGKFDPRSTTLEWLPTKVGDTMTIAMQPADAKEWLKIVPPDLTVEARVRGADWLYNYFLGFYKDDAAASGWNNLVFPNVGMPHVLWQSGGVNRLVSTEYEDHEKAQAAAIAARSLVLLAPGKDHTYVVETLAQETPGTLSPAEYRQMVSDLVNFMDYMAEPAKNARLRLGLMVLLYLGVLFVFAYWLKHEYWKDVH